MSKQAKIVIVGAGFGGISLAKSLANKNVDVVLIDRNNYHTFQPLLYQVATGGLEPSNIAYPIRRIFRRRKNIHFRMAEVESVDYNENMIVTSTGMVPFDYLVVATGSTNNFFNFFPIKNSFKSLKTVSQALDIRNSLMQKLEKLTTSTDEDLKEESLNVSIIGAGPAGVEIAGALAEMKRKVLPKDFPEFDFSRMHVYLFEAGNRVLANMSTESSKASKKYLEEMGVNVVLNAKVKNYENNQIFLEDESTYKSSTVIWTAGVQASPLAGVPVEELVAGKRIKVNEFNQVTDHPNIFAIGDVAAHLDVKNPRGVPMLAQGAVQQGKHLAKNILRLEKNQELLPFVYKDKGVMATVGRNKAVVDLPRFKFQGFFAWFVWMFVHLMALVGFRNKIITFIDWAQNYFNSDRPLGAIIKKVEDEAGN